MPIMFESVRKSCNPGYLFSFVKKDSERMWSTCLCAYGFICVYVFVFVSASLPSSTFELVESFYKIWFQPSDMRICTSLLFSNLVQSSQNLQTSRWHKTFKMSHKFFVTSMSLSNNFFLIII